MPSHKMIKSELTSYWNKYRDSYRSHSCKMLIAFCSDYFSKAGDLQCVFDITNSARMVVI